MSPRVSIGIPVFNGEKYLKKRLDSIAEQTFQDYEIILCDNASTDSTGEIFRQFAAREPRARYVRQPTTVMAGHNYHRAFTESSAPYFIWTAFDDLWDPTFLETLVDLLDRTPDAVLAFCAFDNIDEFGNVVRRFDRGWSRIWSSTKLEQLGWMLWADPGQTQKGAHFYGLYRRSVLAQIDEYFKQDLYAGSDNLALLAALSMGNIVVSEQILFHYRVRPFVRATKVDATYLWRRALGSSPGHQSNLLTAVRRHMQYHKDVSQLIDRRLPLAAQTRLALRIINRIREAERLVTAFPRAIARELL